MLNCGITGSTGVLGKKITKILPYRFKPFKYDLRNKKMVYRWINENDFDIILHLAAIVPTNKVNKNYHKAYQINVEGTKNVVDAIIKKKYKPKWFFFSSTSHVYSLSTSFRKIKENFEIKPQTKYGKTKYLAEKVLLKKLKKTKVKLCIGRIFSYTSRLQEPPFLIPSIIRKIKKSKKKEIDFFNMNHYRDFLNIKDIIKSILYLQKTESVGIFNIGSGKKFYIKNIVKMICNKFNKIPIFTDSLITTYLISNNDKISKKKWKPSITNINNLKYFL